MFELLRRDGLARICRLDTNHGMLETPALLPVINPRMITIPMDELYNEFGFKAVITNSYIIRNNDVLKERALSIGLHEMLDYEGVIMTDSGTFQSYMYGEVDVKNEDIVTFQRDIGSDIGTVLDIFTEPDWSMERTSEAVDVTLTRTEEAADLKGDMLLAGVVQGSIFPELRERCARSLASINADVHPIGGVVPLMEQYRFAELVDVIVASKKGLTPARPVHLFGAGHPMVFALATLLGCDMFDSASYAKFARDGRFMFPEGTFSLNNMRDISCHCPACHGFSYDDIVSMKANERFDLIARHNLWMSQQEIERIKRAIMEGDLWELVERRCRGHPALLDALRRLGDHEEFLELTEPLSRDKSLFYTGPETLKRPALRRYAQRFFERYEYPDTEVMIVFDESSKPYGRYWNKEMREVLERCDSHFFVESVLGPVPIELDEMYPIAQSVLPIRRDCESIEGLKEMMEHMSHEHTYAIAVGWDGPQTLDTLAMLCEDTPTFDLDLARVKAVADMQFGRGAGSILLDGDVELKKSENTGKIRNVLVDGEHILSMRANDGFFTLKIPGARRLQKAFPAPRLRVQVKEDSVPFNRDGKSVFCTFVEDCDQGIRPMDEVLVVDASDGLVAIGRTMLTRDEMLAFKTGVAVKVREGVKK